MMQCAMLTNVSNPDDLLMGPQVGEILGKSARTIARLAAQGDIPYQTKLPGPNGAYLFRRGDVEALGNSEASA